MTLPSKRCMLTPMWALARCCLRSPALEIHLNGKRTLRPSECCYHRLFATTWRGKCASLISLRLHKIVVVQREELLWWSLLRPNIIFLPVLSWGCELLPSEDLVK